MQQIEWLFFDIGSTLADETAADERRIREMIVGTDITPETFRSKRIEFVCEGLEGNQATISYFGLKKTPWHSEDETPYPDAVPTLTELKLRGYRLGIIANQNPGTAQRLGKWDMLRYFDVVAPSAELGVAKPDPAIFNLALSQANCSAKSAAMIGDRLDNDIAPANRLGMHSIRLLRGFYSFREPRLEVEMPEYTVSALTQLLDLF